MQPRSGRDLRAGRLGPVDVEELSTRLVGALVRMCTEEVTLRLQQVGREARRTVAVVVGEGGAEGRHRHAAFGGEGDHLAPAFLRIPDGLGEVWVEEQVCEAGVAA